MTDRADRVCDWPDCQNLPMFASPYCPHHHAKDGDDLE